MKYRYLMGTGTSPYENLAFEQMLMQDVGKDVVIVFLWQNAHTIVIGRNQDPYAECRVEKFLSDGGTVARRKSGGGAVYHDLGNLCFSIISTIDAADACDYRSFILHTLSVMGIFAGSNGRNDLVIDGKKFSGNAIYKSSTHICQHGTILIDADIDKMNAYLTPNNDKLNRNAVASVRSRVMNLTEVLPDLSVKDFCGALIETYGMEPYLYTPDQTVYDRLRKNYADKEWVYKGEIR